MSVVIQILDLNGSYVQEYTADGFEGCGYLKVTADIREAKQYPGIKDVLEEWKRVSTTHPVRLDGKPNRPLSAFTISTVTVE
jgi:hypothetical protein